MVLRRWMIDFFMNDPEEVSEGQELAFYGLIAFFVFAAVAPWVITM